MTPQAAGTGDVDPVRAGDGDADPVRAGGVGPVRLDGADSVRADGAAAGRSDGPVLVVDAELSGAELNTLFHASWPGHHDTDFGPMFARRLLHVTARRDGRLVGYVNVVGDGGAHAFVLDTTVHPDERRKGLGVALVRAAADAARERGAHWLHVDFEPHLTRFYEECGFRPTAAGLMALTGQDG